MKLRDHIAKAGPAPDGDLLYVIHDTHSGWSKLGITRRDANDRFTAVRSRYPELRRAKIVGVIVTSNHSKLESLLLLVIQDRISRRDNVQLIGERFRGLRPEAVLRYARLLGRDLDRLFALFASA